MGVYKATLYRWVSFINKRKGFQEALINLASIKTFNWFQYPLLWKNSAGRSFKKTHLHHVLWNGSFVRPKMWLEKTIC